MHESRTYIKGLLNIRDILRSNLLDRSEVSSSMKGDRVVGGIIPEMFGQILPLK